ncbi:MAG TPA: phosphatidylglycerophosphatase A [Burkholderiales bacterium]|nr:phosphatidylglycerophosphatase A [Burkholderiales bacterium]
MEASITSAEAYGRPSLRFVVSHPAHFIAFGFGVGLSPVAPGTFGTLLAMPMYAWLAPRLDNQQYLLLLAGMFIAGAWACDVSGKRLGVHDHGGMVWDEVTAFLAVLFFTPATLLWQMSAFLLFRLFDIAKPVPIRQFDRNVRNGLGVMLDDMLAAFYALLCLAGWKFLFG